VCPRLEIIVQIGYRQRDDRILHFRAQNVVMCLVVFSEARHCYRVIQGAYDLVPPRH
jgi:hypothetical protein